MHNCLRYAEFVARLSDECIVDVMRRIALSYRININYGVSRMKVGVEYILSK